MFYFECQVCGSIYETITEDHLPLCCYATGDPIGLYISRIRNPNQPRVQK
jgi:hypothetical protein